MCCKRAFGSANKKWQYESSYTRRLRKLRLDVCYRKRKIKKHIRKIRGKDRMIKIKLISLKNVLMRRNIYCRFSKIFLKCSLKVRLDIVLFWDPLIRSLYFLQIKMKKDLLLALDLAKGGSIFNLFLVKCPWV